VIFFLVAVSMPTIPGVWLTSRTYWRLSGARRTSTPPMVRSMALRAFLASLMVSGLGLKDLTVPPREKLARKSSGGGILCIVKDFRPMMRILRSWV